MRQEKYISYYMEEGENQQPFRHFLLYERERKINFLGNFLDTGK